MEYRVVVIGLGSIGQGLDYEAPIDDNSQSLTHATAFYKHPNFKLVAGIDSNQDLRYRFENKFKKPTFSSLRELNGYNPQIIAIAVPTSVHKQTFEEALEMNPEVILCEKPLAETLSESKYMIELAKKKNCSLLVNYIRRFDPGVVELKNRMEKGEYGDVYKATVFYGKGLLNNASHFIDLLCFFFGEPISINILKKGRNIANDIEPDFLLIFQNGLDAYFIASKEEYFSMKEITFITEKGIINFKHGGILINYHPIIDSQIFPGYKVDSLIGEQIHSDFKRYQWHVVNALHRFLSDQIPLASDGVSAYKTQEIVNSIMVLRNQISES